MPKTQAEQAEARRRTAKRKADEAREKAEQTVAYNASRKRGYVPTKETLLAQLEGLYADGKITTQDYDWGVKGLETVHGYVAAAQDEVDPELGF
jgi:hypothetical protein